ncbi:MAG: phasin family protein [Rivihabitans pingtungensis]
MTTRKEAPCSTTTSNWKSPSQAQFDKAVRLSNIVLASAEALCQPAPELSKKLLADQAATTKALVELKDLKAVLEYQASSAQPSIDQAFTVLRSVYDAALQTQNEIQSFVEEQVLEFNKQLCATWTKRPRTRRPVPKWPSTPSRTC